MMSHVTLSTTTCLKCHFRQFWHTEETNCRKFVEEVIHCHVEMFPNGCLGENTNFRKCFLFQLIYLTACKMSTRRQPWYECTGNLLKVTWPTETTFPQDVQKVPDVLGSTISKLLDVKPPYSPMMVILTHYPP